MTRRTLKPIAIAGAVLLAVCLALAYFQALRQPAIAPRHAPAGPAPAPPGPVPMASLVHRDRPGHGAPP